jgi:hypothetical protein
MFPLNAGLPERKHIVGLKMWKFGSNFVF